MNPVKAQELVAEIAGLMLQASRPDTELVAVRFNTAGGFAEWDMFARLDGEMYLHNPDPCDEERRISELLVQLRAATASPEGGAFYVAVIRVNRADGTYDVNYFYDEEPTFELEISPATFAADLKEFPRDPATYPEWLREKLRLAGLDGA